LRIHRRLLLGFVLLLAAALVPSVLLQERWLAGAMLVHMREAMSREATLLAAEYDRAPPPDVGAWARAHEVRTGTRVSILDDKGQLVADSSPLGVDPSQKLDESRRPEVARAREGLLGSDVRASGLDRELLWVAVPLGQTTPHAVLRVARPLETAERVVGRAESALVVGTLVALVVAALFAWVIARWIAAPLDAMTRATRAMAKGEFEQPLPSPPDDEVGDLVRALTLLRGQLAARIAELRAEGEKLKTILDGMGEGVALVQRGRITVANAAFGRLLGAAPDVEGRTPLEAARVPEVSEAVDAVIGRALSSLGVDRDAAGPREVQVGGRTLGVQALPLGAPGSEQAVVVVSDLSEGRRLERLRRDLVANASHELRTPVAAIVAAAETLAGGAAEDPEARASFIDILLRHAHRLARLTQDLLDLSRLEAGYRPRVETVTVDEAVQTVVAELAASAEEKKLALTTELPPGLAVAADRAAIEQVLTNLVENAVKYTPDGGRVVVRASSVDDERVEIAVEDTGPGISEVHQSRIFERFYRVDDARSRELGGTGLGLSIVKHLVLANGGEVGVDSVVGKGSRFWVRLRRAE
jgi:two-component system phosphate regulon sensor histidine kinase PhoR